MSAAPEWRAGIEESIRKLRSLDEFEANMERFRSIKAMHDFVEVYLDTTEILGQLSRRIARFEEFIHDISEEECLCYASAGDCPACRAKALLKENP